MPCRAAAAGRDPGTLSSPPCRPQPDNIYEFGSQDFAELLRESAGTMGAVASSQHHKISDMSQQELEDIVLQIFKARRGTRWDLLTAVVGGR